MTGLEIDELEAGGFSRFIIRSDGGGMFHVANAGLGGGTGYARGVSTGVWVRFTRTGKVPQAGKFRCQMVVLHADASTRFGGYMPVQAAR